MNIKTNTAGFPALSLLRLIAFLGAGLLLSSAALLWTTSPTAAQSNARLTLATDFPADPDQQIVYRVVEVGVPGGFSALVTQSDGDSVNLFPPTNSEISIVLDTRPTGPFATRLSCDGTDPYGTDLRGSARIQLAPGTGTDCTYQFVPANLLTIAVESMDNSGPSTIDFRYTELDSFPYFTANVLASEAAPAQVRVPPGTDLSLRPAGLGVSNITCDDPAFDVSRGTRGVMPANDVTCVYSVNLAASLTVVTERIGGPERDFGYNVLSGGSAYFLLGDNAGTSENTLPVPAGTVVFLQQTDPPGWDISIDCQIEGAGSWDPFDDVTVDLSLAPGDDAICTVTNTWVGVGTITLELLAGGPDIFFFISENFGGGPVLRVGEPSVSEVTADELFVYAAELGPDLPAAIATFDCVDDAGGTIAFVDRIVGQLATDETLTCTVEVADRPTVPISLTVSGPDLGYTGFIRFETKNTLIDSFNLAVGETWTGEASLGLVTEVGAFFLDETGTRIWELTDMSCSGDGGAMGLVVYDNSIAQRGFLGLDSGLTAVHCDLVVRDPMTPFGIFPTVTCLGGNGRIDVNILNVDPVAHNYQLELGNLAPRVRTVAPLDWWRSPVTGRADGPIRAVLLRDGEVILDRELIVDCDDADPTTTAPEVQIIEACRNGDGFIAWQFANPTAATRSYIIEFEGVPNRSTTAGPHGASVRGVSSRSDGFYFWAVKVAGETIKSGLTQVNCDTA